MQQYKSFFGEMHVKIADFAKKKGRKIKKIEKNAEFKEVFTRFWRKNRRVLLH